MRMQKENNVHHYYITRHGISQDAVNKILRPTKKRFKGSEKNQPKKYMSAIARRELGRYRNPNRYQYQFYHAWDPKLGPWETCVSGVYVNWVLKINRGVPPIGPRVRLVNHNGEPIKAQDQVRRRTKKRGRKRQITDKCQEVQKSYNLEEDLENAFNLMDSVFDLLAQHQSVYQKGLAQEGQRVYGPFAQINCRDGQSYQSCNFSRFLPVWLVYLNALTPQGYMENTVTVSLNFEEVPPKYRNKKLQGPTGLLESTDMLEHYKKRVYSIIHSGYDILQDTKEVPKEKEKRIDGAHIFTREVYEGSTKVGYCPDIPNLENSEYMADYMGPFTEQIKKWLGQHSCVHLNREPNYLQSPKAGQLMCKMTIEPSKPRLCYNARPLAGVMKKLACKLDDLGVVLPLLQKGMFGCVSDDKQGI